MLATGCSELEDCHIADIKLLHDIKSLIRMYIATQKI